MKRVILIHGNGGANGSSHWFPFVKKNLEELGIIVEAKNFPDAILAREKFWLPFLENELKPDADVIIVGHSSGAVAAMRFAEKHPLLGSVLVGACYTDLGEVTEKISGYYDKPWDWEAIKRNQKWIVQFASTDDPYIPITEARYVAQKLGTEYHEYTDQGHFCLPNPKWEFPEVVEIIREKLQQIG